MTRPLLAPVPRHVPQAELFARRKLLPWTAAHQDTCARCGGSVGPPESPQNPSPQSSPPQGGSLSQSPPVAAAAAATVTVACGCCDYVYHNRPACLGAFVRAESDVAAAGAAWACPACWEEVEP